MFYGKTQKFCMWKSQRPQPHRVLLICIDTLCYQMPKLEYFSKKRTNKTTVHKCKFCSLKPGFQAQPQFKSNQFVTLIFMKNSFQNLQQKLAQMRFGSWYKLSDCKLDHNSPILAGEGLWINRKKAKSSKLSSHIIKW